MTIKKTLYLFVSRQLKQYEVFYYLSNYFFIGFFQNFRTKTLYLHSLSGNFTYILNPPVIPNVSSKGKRPKITPIFDPKITQNVYTRYIYFIYQLYPHHTLANLFNKISRRIKVVFGTKKPCQISTLTRRSNFIFLWLWVRWVGMFLNPVGRTRKGKLTKWFWVFVSSHFVVFCFCLAEHD